MDDEQIRAALRGGHPDAAFRMVQRAYGAAVYATCYRILRDQGAAEDAMQQTLIAAFRSQSQLLGVDQIRGWLIRTASRKCFDALRSSKRAVRLQRDVSNSNGAQVVDDGGALTQLATGEERRALEACLAALDHNVAAAVLMRYREAMSWEEIAEIVGLPLDRIRMQVNRGALRRLRACLEAKGIVL